MSSVRMKTMCGRSAADSAESALKAITQSTDNKSSRFIPGFGNTGMGKVHGSFGKMDSIVLRILQRNFPFSVQHFPHLRPALGGGGSANWFSTGTIDARCLATA